MKKEPDIVMGCAGPRGLPTLLVVAVAALWRHRREACALWRELGGIR